MGCNDFSRNSEAEKLLTDKEDYRSMARGVSPYGDGKAAERIVSIIKKREIPGCEPEVVC